MHLLNISCFVLVCLFQIVTAAAPIPSDPDSKRMIPDLIQSRGFRYEVHNVTTKDGYILGTYRIVNPVARSKLKNVDLKPVLIQCGLLCSGSEFLDNSVGGDLNVDILKSRNNLTQIDFAKHGNNLGFILANLGYDVWFFHPRGNYYSRTHTTLNPDHNQTYWQFTWNEMATIDLPTTIDYILQLTKRKSIGYIGYSQGGTTLFALLADQPKYSEKLKPAIAIAPAVRLDNYASSMKKIFENPLIMAYVKKRGGECFPYFEHDPKALCKEPLVKPICDYVTYNFLTINKKQVNQSRVGVQIAHLPSGSSCWDILHYLQIMKSRKFTKFDYGWTENFKRYGNIYPPEYPLDKIDSKYLSFIVSIGDHTADPNDIYTLKRLLKSVPSIREYTIMDDTFDHLDYILSKNTGTVVNLEITRILNDFRY